MTFLIIIFGKILYDKCILLYSDFVSIFNYSINQILILVMIIIIIFLKMEFDMFVVYRSEPKLFFPVYLDQ